MLGEVMSFYLARLLGINTVPAVILSQVSGLSSPSRYCNQYNTKYLETATNRAALTSASHNYKASEYLLCMY